MTTKRTTTLLHRRAGRLLAIAAAAALLSPAALGIIGDIAPKEQQARWIGVVMGSYSVGFVFGPVLGGVLYDAWGYAAPFLVSATMAAIALIGAEWWLFQKGRIP